MADFPSPNVLPQFVSSYSRYCVAYDILRANNSAVVPASIAWSGANLAIYMPVSIPFQYPVQRVFWGNGSVITSSHVDFGIYSPSGAKVYSTGSTAQSGTSAIQYVTPGTPFLLDPGIYYFAYTCDNTTNRSFGIGSLPANAINLAGCLSQSSALPLPSPATFVSCTAAVIPICGITRTSSGF